MIRAMTLLALFAAMLVVVTAIGLWPSSRSGDVVAAEYRRAWGAVRYIARPGRQVSEVRGELIERGFEVGEPYRRSEGADSIWLDIEVGELGTVSLFAREFLDRSPPPTLCDR